ncbi:TlpA disulfide reductase family protein [Pseudonocardia sp. KRD291]|uniref:TlpA family protein disulfide reductase n=1 Tax=Pseudonocardia sp. KRD291 TaxID=2792007 RepID=UPI001C4A4EC3|nr:TlpA disulfide reductase family protein [Pseudonocardia sp. KRD291]MBW0103404.1 TlpA family protein disulfide reductase [Pseudonocardia sp. KRD291]
MRPAGGVRARRVLAAVLAVMLLVAGCSTSKDAVDSDGEFQFVAPGGQTRITYDPPASRGRISDLAGDSLLRPGTRVGVDSYPGKVVVLNLWGSWCGPCRTEAPELQYVATNARDTAVLGVDVRDDRQAAQDFVRDRGLTYDSIYDFPGRTLTALAGYPRNVVPSTIVLDRAHRVAAVFLLPVGASDLMPLVGRLAAEPAATAPAP